MSNLNGVRVRVCDLIILNIFTKATITDVCSSSWKSVWRSGEQKIPYDLYDLWYSNNLLYIFKINCM